MTEERSVPYGDDASQTATLLLAAAEELGYDADVVRTTSGQTFRVPLDVADKSGLPVEEEQEQEGEPTQAVPTGNDTPDGSVDPGPPGAPADQVADERAEVDNQAQTAQAAPTDDTEQAGDGDPPKTARKTATKRTGRNT